LARAFAAGSLALVHQKRADPSCRDGKPSAAPLSDRASGCAAHDGGIVARLLRTAARALVQPEDQ
jgi:hypothetical protein